jgi:hypothetical protein
VALIHDMVNTHSFEYSQILRTEMDSQATQERAPALPFPLRWNLLAFLQHYNLSIMLSLLSFYSSQERRMRQWYSDVRLAAARKRKKSAAKMRSERFDQYYAAGKHLFTRATLLDVATQIASGEAFLHFDDFLGLLPSRERSRVPGWLTPEWVHCFHTHFHLLT